MLTHFSPFKTNKFLSILLFSTLYLFLFFEFFAIVRNSSDAFFIWTVAGFFFLLTLLNSFWGVCLFVVAVPLLNGLFLMKGFGDVSFAFAGLFTAWLPKKIFKAEDLNTLTLTSYFSNLLAVLVLLNVSLVLFRISDGSIPSRFWLNWFSFFPYAHQHEFLWQINGALILLKGILLFNIFEVELKGKSFQFPLGTFFIVQTIIIAGFSLFQFVIFQVQDANYLGVNLPFNDIHSYGSYVVFLFVVFTYYFLETLTIKKKGITINSGINRSGKGAISSPLNIPESLNSFSRNSIITGSLAVVLCILCVLSFSRMTWLVMGLFLFLLVIATINSRKLIGYLGLALVLIFFVGGLLSSKFMQSENPALIRAGSFFNVKELSQEKSLQIRYEIWDRAEKMIRQFPLTGVGAGNFYRNNVYFKSKSMDRWDYENAHNYFLQITAELGVPGLFIFLLMIYSLYFPQSVAREGMTQSGQNDITPIKFGLAAYLVTMLTGHPLLLLNQQLLFWSAVAMISAEQYQAGLTEKRKGFPKTVTKTIGTGALIVYFLGFCLNIYHKEPWTIPVQYGLYSTEDWNGRPMQWMTKKARYALPKGTAELSLHVEAQPFNSQPPEGLVFKVKINDTVVDQIRFIDGGTEDLSYDLKLYNSQDMKITLEVDKVFCPREIGLNNDPRKLGVAIGFTK